MTQRMQQQKKAAFIAHFSVHGNIAAAARAVHIDRSTVYRWQESDDAFANAFRTAEREATEALEHEAYRRAARGVQKPVYQNGKLVGHIREFSDTLLIFLLKARDPEKYRERYDANLHGDGGMMIVAEGRLAKVAGDSSN